MQNNFYITTPIYYVNDIPHIGHAYTSYAADSLARYNKLLGKKVFFSTGTDEHGQKVELSARDKNMEVESFTDTISKKFKDLSETLNLSNNDFIRTTEIRHKDYVCSIWKKLLENDQIYLDVYKGWYSVRDESFISEADIKIDENQNKIGPSGDLLRWVEEPSYFFRLSNWQEQLLNLYNKNKDFVMPKSRFNEVIKFVEGGLEDLSISRTSFKWGIKVPDDPKHVMYVWLDALFNYISVLKNHNNKNIVSNFWPANFHIVGKDILRFHAVYWPAFLLAANIEFPKTIFAHGWWTINGSKMSKSLGNTIDPNFLVEKYGSDTLRYFLLREIPFGEDGNFSEELLKIRANSDLSNDYGNLIQRVLAMVVKYKNGIVPEGKNLNNEDKSLIKTPINDIVEIEKLMKSCQFNLVLATIWKNIRAANAYVDKNKPWSLAKENSQRLDTVLNVLVNTIFKINTILQPFLPSSTIKIFNMLGQFNEIEFKDINREIEVGTKIIKPVSVFPRIES